MPRIHYRVHHIVLILLSVSIFWTLFYQNTFKIQKHETFTLFITANYVDTKTLEDTIQTQFAEKGIRKVEVIVISQSDTYFTTQFMTRGLLDSDLLILPKNLLDQFDLNEQFLPIQSALISSISWTTHTLDALGKPHAMRVYESGATNHLRFNALLDETQDYYVVINKDSVHPETLLNQLLLSLIQP